MFDNRAGIITCRLSQLPGDAVSVIRACLQVDPLLRPSASELLHLPFFSDVQVAGQGRSRSCGALAHAVGLWCMLWGCSMCCEAVACATGP